MRSRKRSGAADSRPPATATPAATVRMTSTQRSSCSPFSESKHKTRRVCAERSKPSAGRSTRGARSCIGTRPGAMGFPVPKAPSFPAPSGWCKRSPRPDKSPKRRIGSARSATWRVRLVSMQKRWSRRRSNISATTRRRSPTPRTSKRRSRCATPSMPDPPPILPGVDGRGADVGMFSRCVRKRARGGEHPSAVPRRRTVRGHDRVGEHAGRARRPWGSATVQRGAMSRRRVSVGRVYDERRRGDGVRVLVDRLWPRGLSRERADLDEWCKDVAPSPELRRWYAHDSERFAEFRRRYRAELREPARAEALDHLRALAKRRNLTLLTATKSPEISEAAVLHDLLDSR